MKHTINVSRVTKPPVESVILELSIDEFVAIAALVSCNTTGNRQVTDEMKLRADVMNVPVPSEYPYMWGSIVKAEKAIKARGS